MKSKTCLNCGTSFELNFSYPHKKFCCKACKKHYKHTKRITKYEYVCINCGETYHPKEKNRDKFCSRKCTFEYRSKTPSPLKTSEYVNVLEMICNFITAYVGRINICVECGKLFICKQNQKAKFCCRKCGCYYKNKERHNEIISKCVECGVNYIIRYGDKRKKFCSVGCMRKFNKRKRNARVRIGKKK